jgi:hypothetical protein
MEGVMYVLVFCLHGEMQRLYFQNWKEAEFMFDLLRSHDNMYDSVSELCLYDEQAEAEALDRLYNDMRDWAEPCPFVQGWMNAREQMRGFK